MTDKFEIINEEKEEYFHKLQTNEINSILVKKKPSETTKNSEKIFHKTLINSMNSNVANTTAYSSSAHNNTYGNNNLTSTASPVITVNNSIYQGNANTSLQNYINNSTSSHSNYNSNNKEILNQNNTNTNSSFNENTVTTVNTNNINPILVKKSKTRNLSAQKKFDNSMTNTKSKLKKVKKVNVQDKEKQGNVYTAIQTPSSKNQSNINFNMVSSKGTNTKHSSNSDLLDYVKPTKAIVYKSKYYTINLKIKFNKF